MRKLILTLLIIPSLLLADPVTSGVKTRNPPVITGRLPVYSDTTGKFIQDSGFLPGDLGDNLGNHIATQDLDMSTFDIIDAGYGDFADYLDAVNGFRMDGDQALWQNTTDDNLFVGSNAGNQGYAGAVDNVMMGDGAAPGLTSGDRNTLVGVDAGNTITTHNDNTGVGYQSCKSGSRNSALGYWAGYAVTGSDNIFLGWQGGAWVTSGNYNTMLGMDTGRDIATTSYNVCVGARCQFGGSTATYNTGVGGNILARKVAGTYNTVVGGLSTPESRFLADKSLDYVSYLGYSSGGWGCPKANMDGTICIGAFSGAPNPNSAAIGGYDPLGTITNVFLGGGYTNPSPSYVRIYSTGGLGTDISGGDLEFWAGAGTGTGVGGDLEFFTATASGTGGTDLNTHAVRMIVHQSGEVEMTDHLKFLEIAAEPANEANYAKLWAEDDSGTVELWAADEAGNEVVLTPHNFGPITNDPYFAADPYPICQMQWNEFIGKQQWFYISKMCKLVEGLTGEKLIYTEDEPTKKIDWAKAEKDKQIQVAAKIAQWDAKDTAFKAWEAIPFDDRFKDVILNVETNDWGIITNYQFQCVIYPPQKPKGDRPDPYVPRKPPAWLAARTNLVTAISP